MSEPQTSSQNHRPFSHKANTDVHEPQDFIYLLEPRNLFRCWPEERICGQWLCFWIYCILCDFDLSYITSYSTRPKKRKTDSEKISWNLTELKIWFLLKQKTKECSQRTKQKNYIWNSRTFEIQISYLCISELTHILWWLDWWSSLNHHPIDKIWQSGSFF